MGNKVVNLEEHRIFSEVRLKELSIRFNKIEELEKNNLCVYATGSYGRLEASSNSDIDLFFIDTNDKDPITNIDKTIINSEIIKICRYFDLPEFSKDGLFLTVHSLKEIKSRLGSPEDDYYNHFTTRMLLLLESKPLYNALLYEKSIDNIIENYYIDFHKHVQDFKPIFLANDLIRFWKTLCLNYEHRRKRKSFEGDDSEKIVAHTKNLKLKFSRKLTVFSFILKLVDTQGTINKDYVREIVYMTPLERLISLKKSNPQISKKIDKAVSSYQWFIGKTQIPSEQMLRWISNAKNRRSAFKKSDQFADEIFDILQAIDKQSIIPKLLI